MKEPATPAAAATRELEKPLPRAKCPERHPVKLIRGLPSLIAEGKKRGLVAFR